MYYRVWGLPSGKFITRYEADTAEKHIIRYEANPVEKCITFTRYEADPVKKCNTTYKVVPVEKCITVDEADTVETYIIKYEADPLDKCKNKIWGWSSGKMHKIWDRFSGKMHYNLRGQSSGKNAWPDMMPILCKNVLQDIKPIQW